MLMLSFVTCSQLRAEESTEKWGAISPGLFASRDSDGFNVIKLSGAVLPLYQDAQHYMGIQLASHHFSTDGWSKNSTQVSFINHAINPADGLGHDVNLGLNNLSSRQLVTADVDYAFPVNPNTSIELFFNRDWVETKNSLSNGTSYNYYGGSLEYRFAKDWTVIGLVSQHQFSDENTRTHWRGKLIYDLFPEYGITLQLRHREFRNSDESNENYFNPDKYQENMLALGMRKRVNSWILVGTLGIGRQKVADDPKTTTKLAEFEVSSPIYQKIFLKTKLGYGQSATFMGPDFSYHYIQANLIFNF